ncbi:MAG: hypothetical protein ACK4XJ_01025 [Fimbriimonadaceae bacterium]
MLNSIAVAVAVLGVAGQDAAQPSPGQLISGMLRAYAEARTIVGSVQMVQRMGPNMIQVRTQVQLERPAKLYILQTSSAAPRSDQDIRVYNEERRRWLVTSDGNAFSYDAPRGILVERDAQRFAERAIDEQGKARDVGSIYRVVKFSLGDKSPVLDILTSSPRELELLRTTWKTVEYKGTTKITDEPLHVVEGNWVDEVDPTMTGRYQFLVTEAGDLRRYTIRARFNTPEFDLQRNETRLGGTEIIETVWDVNVRRDAAPDQNLFKVIL